MAKIRMSATLARSGYYGQNCANYEHETSLGIFFFSTRENWVVVFASRESNGNATCHLNKERDSCGCGKRNSSGHMMRKLKKKKKIGTRWVFVDILILVIIEYAKG
jgi:hypothetical protein